jgi:hypothetical protein
MFCDTCGCVFGISYPAGASAAARIARGEAKHNELAAPLCDADGTHLRLLTDRPVHAGDREARA